MAKKGKQNKANKGSSKKRDDSDEEEPSKGKKLSVKPRNGAPHGLGNLGNTCFFNSILQCLNASSPFSDKMIGLSKEGIGGVSGSLAGLFAEMRQGGHKSISPKKLLGLLAKKCPWYGRRDQQDAHELLRMLLGAMSDERTPAEKGEERTSPGSPTGVCEKTIWDHFRGHLFSSVLCWNCQCVSLALDPFLDLSLALPSAGTLRGPLGLARADAGGVRKTGGKKAAHRSATKSKSKSKSKDKDDSETGFEILLKRPTDSDPWGFEWSEDGLGEDSFVVASIAEDSAAGKFNAKQRSEELLIRKGDRVVRVGKDTTDFKGIENAFETEKKLGIRFLRAAQIAAKKDEEAEEDAASSSSESEELSTDELRSRYTSQAEQLLSNADLPKALRDVFGAEGLELKDDGCCELSDCLHQFTGVESLADDFKPSYACSECGKEDSKRRSFASRRLWLWPSLPPLLTLQLKRFERRGASAHFDKSEDSVDVPPILDLSDFILDKEQLKKLGPHLTGESDKQLLSKASKALKAESSPPRYELYGLCVHYGGSLKSGHYIAYVNGGPSLEKEDWYYVSDSSVSQCSREIALKAEAYVAFYRQEGVNDGAEGSEAGSDGDAGESLSD